VDRANAGSGCFKALIGRNSNRGNTSTKDKGTNYSIVLLVPFFLVETIINHVNEFSTYRPTIASIRVH